MEFNQFTRKLRKSLIQLQIDDKITIPGIESFKMFVPGCSKNFPLTLNWITQTFDFSSDYLKSRLKIFAKLCRSLARIYFRREGPGFIDPEPNMKARRQ